MEEIDDIGALLLEELEVIILKGVTSPYWEILLLVLLPLSLISYSY